MTESNRGAAPLDGEIGPVEYIVLEFAGSRFTGEIVPALKELLESRIVRIIDLAVIAKDEDGAVTLFEMQELSAEVAEALTRLTGDVSGLLSEADLMELAETVQPGDTAAAILFEHVWAKTLAGAVRRAGGRLVLAERIPHAVVEEARTSLLAAAAG